MKHQELKNRPKQRLVKIKQAKKRKRYPLQKQSSKTENLIIRNAKQYDVTNLEVKNGISQKKKERILCSSTTEGIEQKLGVKEKKDKTKENLVPKERMEEKETIEHLAEKQKVRSKTRKDNLKRKQKKDKKQKSTITSAAKRELKFFLAKQVLTEENNRSVGEVMVDFGKCVLATGGQKVGNKIVQGVSTVFFKIITRIITMLSLLFFSIVGLFVSIFFPFLLVVLLGGGFLVSIAVLAGLFVYSEDVTKDDFAVTLIDNYKTSIIQEANTYARQRWHGEELEKVTIVYDGISNIDANSDDILLAYLTEATTSSNFSVEDSQAPLLNVDTDSEQKAMNTVLKEMFYIKTVVYEEKTRIISVIVTPTPPLTSDTIPEESWNTEGTLPLIPETMVSETIEIIETYYVATVIISGESANDWATEHNKNQPEAIYPFLLEIFESLGYYPKGGATVCEKYRKANLE